MKGDVTTVRIEKELIKYISAFTLGDGNIRMGKTHAAYRNAQMTIHKDYIDYQVSILSEITSVNIRYEERNGRQPRYAFETKQHPLFTKVYNRMYIDNHKVIDPHYLKLIDWECLAILHQDDGHLAKRYNTEYDRLDYNIIIATESFSFGDNYLLSLAVKERLGIAFDIVNQSVNGQIRHRLRLSKRQTPLFIEKITPFIAPSFNYKISLERLTPEFQGEDTV